MKRTVRNYIIRIAIVAILAAAVILIAAAYRPSWEESTEQRADREIEQEQDLLLWYYDASLTPYVEQMAADYFRKTGLRVGTKLVSVVSFFEDINSLNVSGGRAPDLYITDTSRLEQAYLGSVAKPNAYPDTYSLRNYSVKALTSVRYHDKMVAYPLCFDMAFFAYNRDYMDKAPASFAQIASESASFKKNADSPVDMVLLYEASDLLYNYQFIGNSLHLGGENGDDDRQLSVDGDALLTSLESYRDFSEKLNINLSTTSYDLAENSFVFGRSMSAILKCSSLTSMNREGTNYEICSMPPVTNGEASAPLSTTLCVCVNPMASDVKGAEELAKYMTFENTEKIYDLTGYLSCKRQEYASKGFGDVYLLYDETASLPKFIETEELWRDLKRMLNNVWNGEDVMQNYNDFSASFQLHLATRAGQEQK